MGKYLMKTQRGKNKEKMEALKDDEKKARKFLLEILKLCKKYDASIGGCGCCGSPIVRVGNWKSDDLSANATSVETADKTVYAAEGEE